MMDYREQLLTDIGVELTVAGYDKDEVRRITALMLPELNKYRLEINLGELVTGEERNGQFIRAFIATKLQEGKSRRTAQAYAFLLKTFAADMGKCLTDVQTFDIRMWLARREQKASLATCENYRAYLSSFYQWMDEEEIIKHNPMKKLKPIKVPEKVKTPFSAVETDALREACTGTRDRALLEVMLSSGVRVSELTALDVADIDFATRRLTVRDGKGGKGRTTYISDVCADRLQKYLNERGDSEGELFRTRLGGRMTASGVEKLLRSLGAACGIKNVHPHRCRRTFATELARRGMPVQEIMRLMGHSDLSTTMIYLYMDDRSIENSYNRCG